MEKINKNDIVVSKVDQHTDTGHCFISKNYISKTGYRNNEFLWFEETTSGEGAYKVKNFRLATEEECKLFEEKGPHILSIIYSEDLTGRYVKALKDSPECTNFKTGEYALIRSGKPKNIILDRLSYTADVYREGCWELMPEGFDPNAISPPTSKFNVGDVVDLNNLGYEYTAMDRNANDPNYTWAVISNCNVQTSIRAGCKIEDKVYSTTMDVWWYKLLEKGNWISEGGLTLNIEASDTPVKSNYKVGDWVVITENYVGEVLKGKVFQIVSRLSENSTCWIVNHSDEPYLAPYERCFRMAEPHEIPTQGTPDIKISPLVYGVVSLPASVITSGTANSYSNSAFHPGIPSGTANSYIINELHPRSLPTFLAQTPNLYGTSFQEIPKVMLNNVNNVPHQEPKILRQKTKKRKLIIV